MNEQEVIERVAVAIFTADATQTFSGITWASANDFTRDTYRILAKAAMTELRRIQEEQDGNE